MSEEQIDLAVHRLSREISGYYATRHLTIIGVITGCVVLLAGLSRLLAMPLRVGLVQARSYRGSATSPGPLVLSADVMPEVRGQDVLLVDDIFDTGNTLNEIVRQLQAHQPSSLRSAVLLRKQGRCQVEIQPDHVGFEIPDVFVVGYGLDYRDLYRNLPYVAALEGSDLTADSGP